MTTQPDKSHAEHSPNDVEQINITDHDAISTYLKLHTYKNPDWQMIRWVDTLFDKSTILGVCGTIAYLLLIPYFKYKEYQWRQDHRAQYGNRGM